MVYRNSEGKKMYPVCSWEKNQHKVYNAHDRAVVEHIESGYSRETAEWLDRVERAMGVFDSNVRNGIVYATWEDGQLIKSIIGGYDFRH